MAGITPEIAEEQLTSCLNALLKVREGQAVERNGKRLTRADLSELRADVRYWRGLVFSLSKTNGGGISTVEGIPR